MRAKGEPGARPSIRSTLLRQVMAPLIATWAVGALLVAVIAGFFIDRAFDAALLDDAFVIASRVELNGSTLRLNMTAADINTVLFDQTDKIYFSVQRDDGTPIAGRPDLQAHAFEPGKVARANLLDHDQPMRGLILRRNEPEAFSVIVIQTITGRTRFLQRLLLYSALPQIALLLMLALWLRRAIRRALEPLTALQHAVNRRDATDLAPLPSMLAHAAPSLDVQRLGSAINALLMRVGESMKAQREFAGNVAHELRTPLAGIRALAEYALAQSDPDIWREQLQAVARSELRTSHLVDQLLALALADESQFNITLEPVEIDRVVRQMVFHFLARADAAGVDLGASGLDASICVSASEALLEGVLGNLIDNALRYGMPTDGRRPVVTVALHDAWDAIELSVIDNGPGIPPDEQPQMILRWLQGPTGQGLGEGAGLGLAIVARYAQLIHATFRIATGNEGVGLAATLRFDKPGPGS